MTRIKLPYPGRDCMANINALRDGGQAGEADAMQSRMNAKLAKMTEDCANMLDARGIKHRLREPGMGLR